MTIFGILVVSDQLKSQQYMAHLKEVINLQNKTLAEGLPWWRSG